MTDLSTLIRYFFQYKSAYAQVEDADKERFLFVFNRALACGFPLRAEKLNGRGIEKATALDVWFNSLQNLRTTPSWFTVKNKAKKSISTNNPAELLELEEKDIYLLKNYYPEEWAAFLVSAQEAEAPAFELRRIPKSQRKAAGGGAQ